MNKVPFVCVVAAIFCAFPLPSHAADYLGADAILKQAAAPAEPNKSSKDEDAVDSAKKLLRDLKAFRETSASLSADEAASRWFAFADRLAKIPSQELYGSNEEGERNPGLGSLLESLPPPAVWDALVKAAEARPEGQNAEAIRTHILRLTMHWLTGNATGQEKEMTSLRTLANQAKEPARRYVLEALDQCEEILLQKSDNGPAILANLNKRLNQSDESDNSGRRELSVPDLVSLVGVKEATAFLKKALKAEHVQIQVQEGEETKSLARKLALQGIEELKQPQWALAQSLEAAPLFETMSKRFPKSDKNDYNMRSAQAYYLLSLVASHRTKEAIAVAKQMGDGSNASLPEEGMNALERAGHTQAVATFLHDLLEQNPNLPFWQDYVKIAPKAGQTDQMVALAETASKREGMTPKQQVAILRVLARAYLAADNVAKGIEVIRKEIEVAKTIPADETSSYSELTDVASTLTDLGIVLERQEIVDEGLQVLRDSLKNSNGSKSPNRTLALQTLARLLAEAKRGPEAEAVLGESLAKSMQPGPGHTIDYNGVRQTLIRLMALYHQANRPADVLALLDRASSWGAKDLKEIFSETVKVDDNEEYVGFLAASALAASGRTQEALRIVDALLEQAGGYDPAYELLIQLAPDTAMAKLDALFARDQFEERPLIWKARMLLKAGKLEEAEKCARQAIAIDPTDGEEGPGRRLRAYATLGEIREARGDSKEATFLKEVLTSVHHSDTADRLHEAGLITRALKIYEESLTHFADAYCIQARLAFRMAELGDMAGAEEHYRRAYELMPDQFGRVESYCFGCEGAFQGAQAQGIAERVFTKLAEKSPEKPQIHYLLGYLRTEQGRYKDALPEFRQAVKLDPDYLNAWKKIADTSEKLRLPAAERDAIQFNLLRLDPLGRHSDFEFDHVSDLRAAWTAMDNAAKLKVPAPQSLYPLTASAEEMKRQQDEAAKNPGHQRMYYPSYSRSKDETPGKKIAEQSFVNMLNQFFISAAQIYRE